MKKKRKEKPIELSYFNTQISSVQLSNFIIFYFWIVPWLKWWLEQEMKTISKFWRADWEILFITQYKLIACHRMSMFDRCFVVGCQPKTILSHKRLRLSNEAATLNLNPLKSESKLKIIFFFRFGIFKMNHFSWVEGIESLWIPLTTPFTLFAIVFRISIKNS